MTITSQTRVQLTPDTEERIIKMIQINPTDPTRRRAAILTLAAQELRPTKDGVSVLTIIQYANKHALRLQQRLNTLIQIH